MTDPITLYAHTHPSRAERCLWVLEELALPHTVTRLAIGPDGTGSAAFLAISPAGKIPALTHGERALTESLPICEYLARLKPEATLLPQSDAEQFEYAQLLHYLLTEIEAYLWVRTQAGAIKDKYPWPKGTASFAKTLIEQHLPGLVDLMDADGFACLGRFSVADIMICHVTGWITQSGIDAPAPLLAHRERMLERPRCPAILKPGN